VFIVFHDDAGIACVESSFQLDKLHKDKRGSYLEVPQASISRELIVRGWKIE
jgi:hypothetical protein